jgi:hypothetical protein
VEGDPISVLITQSVNNFFEGTEIVALWYPKKIDRQESYMCDMNRAKNCARKYASGYVLAHLS